MRDSWLRLVDSLLRPARLDLERCLREREQHLADRRLAAETRLRQLARCEAQIEDARAAVRAATDGVVTSRMTDLEREWRMLSRTDPDRGLMDLWARVAAVSWIDRKRWRDSEPLAQVDAAIALAADAEGVETAECAVDSLRVALAAWGVPVGKRIRWRLLGHDAELLGPWLAAPLHAAREVLLARGIEAAVLERARRLERDVDAAVRVRFPDRGLLARDLAHAALVDGVFRAASLAGRPNPVTSLCALWKVGYVLTAIDASSVTLGIPPLGP